MKKILITGKNSYIGNSFEKWLKKEVSKYKVDSLSMRDDSWKNKDLSEYDVVLHVAGIAHVSTNPKMKDLYYKVNRDLTIELAKKIKADGVKQFIFMSSMIVYSDSSSKKVIGTMTIPTPNTFYGDSKLQAENSIKSLESDDFKIVILRPPMVYGRGAKGNYLRLANVAKKTPVFPYVDNQRSMIHIDNLCEFLKIMIDYEETGLFFPQNSEYVNTSEMVKLIGEFNGNKIKMTESFNWLIRKMFRVNIVNKVFGSLVYEKTLSRYSKANYQIRNFEESIEITESRIGE